MRNAAMLQIVLHRHRHRVNAIESDRGCILRILGLVIGSQDRGLTCNQPNLATALWSDEVDRRRVRSRSGYWPKTRNIVTQAHHCHSRRNDHDILVILLLKKKRRRSTNVGVTLGKGNGPWFVQGLFALLLGRPLGCGTTITGCGGIAFPLKFRHVQVRIVDGWCQFPTQQDAAFLVCLTNKSSKDISLTNHIYIYINIHY